MEVKIALLTPLLRSIARSASVFPGGAVSSFKMLFNVESVTEQRVHIPGTKPGVDYLIKGVESSGVNNCKYLIPVEGKGLLKLKHCLQLASYMCRTNTCQDLRGQVHLGICIELIKISSFFLFSPLEHHRRPLPIFYQSPPFTWRNNLELKRESCLLLALAYLLHA